MEARFIQFIGPSLPPTHPPIYSFNPTLTLYNLTHPPTHPRPPAPHSNRLFLLHPTHPPTHPNPKTGEDLDCPFDKDGSLNIYKSLVSALRLIVSAINHDGYNPLPRPTHPPTKPPKAPRPPTSSSVLTGTPSHPSLSSPRNALAPKSFTFDDADGEEQVHTKRKAYEPLQYLLTVLYLLSHTSVQTVSS